MSNRVRVVPAPTRLEPGVGAFPLAGAGVTGPLAAVAAAALGVPVGDGRVVLAIEPGHGAEGYRLEVTASAIRLTADAEEGLYRGIQTLRQLAVDGRVPAVTIDDAPRFAYRGAMLDLARHVFDADAVCRFLDAIALLKVNHLHLHLTDDQGWRIELASRPELTARGASTQVGGGGGGYLTRADYRRIVEHAARRYITIVPEVDVPGHTNAAIVAIPELGVAPAEPYEGVEVGFSSLAIRRESTYDFLADVFAELAELTPGPYLHLGGDESLATSDDDFRSFVARATAIVAATGKIPIGWHEIGRSDELPPGTIGQYWSFTTPRADAAERARGIVAQGGRLILSPADVAYLDMKRAADDDRGLTWANGPTGLAASRDWEPTRIVAGLAEEAILGVEAPIWTETLETIEQVEEFAFPRLAAIAEVGWSAPGVPVDDFLDRVGAVARLWDADGTRYWRTPEVRWG